LIHEQQRNQLANLWTQQQTLFTQYRQNVRGVAELQQYTQQIQGLFVRNQALQRSIIEQRQALLSRMNRQVSHICINILLSPNCDYLQSSLAQLDIFAVQLSGQLNTFSWSGMEGALRQLEAELQDVYEQKQQQFVSNKDVLMRQALLQQMCVLLLSCGVLLWLLYNYRDEVNAFALELRQFFQPNVDDTPLPTRGYNYPELQQISLDLRRLEKNYQTLEKMKNAMLRHAAHELKTPLASITEGCEVLSQELVGYVNDEQKEVLGLLAGSIKRMHVLVERLLDYNALLQYKTVKANVFSIAKVINNALEEQQLALRKAGMEVIVNVPTESVCTDRMLFRRILDNLLSNAMAHGQQHANIQLDIMLQDEKLTINCSNLVNHSRTVSKEDVFEPFQRGQHKRNDGVVGAGLGLSIIAECAKLLGGSAQLDKSTSGIFRITVNLPLDEYQDETGTEYIISG
jgi:two-component system sensor histidine kinase GlrK